MRSGNDNVEDQQFYLDQGADGSLSKSLDLKLIGDLMSKWVEEARHRAAQQEQPSMA